MAANRKRKDNKGGPQLPRKEIEDLPPAPAGKKWVKKKRWWNCTPVKCFLLILVAIFVLNFASLKREEKALFPQGELYDIGWGQKLFMRCTGKGTPVVLLDSPIGETSDIWTMVEPLLNKHTKVCVYDRAGLGFSHRGYRNTTEYAQDYGKEAKRRDTLTLGTIERMVDDLHRLLHVSSVVGDSNTPLLLVGMDFSTLISRFYAQFYENEVAGLVLIDPLVETLFDNNSTWSQYWYNEVISHVRVLYLSSLIGINRIALLTGYIKPIENKKVVKIVSENIVNRRKYLMCNSVHLSSVIEEIAMTNDSLAQVKTVLKVKPFPQDIPVAVVKYKDFDKSAEDIKKLWNTEQEGLKRVHSQLKEYFIPGADFNSMYLHPQAIASIILKSINQWREDNVKQ
ncbi:PREDICTED: uncharacterized protein LOC100631396 [Amphimedon queenslandica]|uniref:AB hydrolase-1 domain-containing protein n=1 Tax=Amphimedon queenslandica TaxID=400682 RepID=A0A1X7V733_AMPQE|nr:PREDICTED: uncharacterized protein LOC100631396 [Amphimedon queenslandica]|eukprot:XP_003385364.1 PREDICTED: uncharacterized protein LOC100631396 [Amphimedon queenslandica]